MKSVLSRIGRWRARLYLALTAGGMRPRFLLAAGVLTVLFVVAAIGANLELHNTTQANSAAVATRDMVMQACTRIRNAIWSAESTMHHMLITPEPDQEQEIRAQLIEAREIADSLYANRELAVIGIGQQLRDLQTRLVMLENQFHFLAMKRADGDWVYPALPYISGTMLRANTEFISAVNLALADVAASENGTGTTSLYRHLSEVRDTWRRIINVFRASMIRYAGLHDVEPGPQEKEIADLYELLRKQLKMTGSFFNSGIDTFLVEDSLGAMERSAVAWYADLDKVTALRRSRSWRADITYFTTSMQPGLKDTFRILRDIDKALNQWSSGNLLMLEQAATTSSHQLWFLAVLAMGFVLAAYLVLNRAVLVPMEKIAEAIRKISHDSDVELPVTGGSREVRVLIDAYEAMRQRIHERQQALEHQALHDALTGLPNRVLMNDRLEQALIGSRRAKSSTGFLLLDLDRFKEVNDTLGHHVGDHLLQQVAMRLQGVVRESDTVARLGGDEFAVVMSNADADTLRATAMRIAEALDEVFIVDGSELYVGASMGIALYPEHGNDAATLVRHADTAMYVSKRSGDVMAFYEQWQDAQGGSELALTSDLRSALVGDALELYYQPTLDLRSGAAVGVEALLRWNHSQHGDIGPEHIVRLAESCGLIDQLTDWVVKRAVEDCRELLLDQSISHVSVNISTKNLRDSGFAGRITDRLQQSGLAPSMLMLEVTESAVMTDPVKARVVLEQLQQLDVKLVIDDYGTGFSSLGYLKMLPVSGLKIDKSFVIHILEQSEDLAIVRSTIDLAHSLDLWVTAEGVESAAAMRKLSDLGCDHVQGYYVSKPLQRKGLSRWLAARVESGVSNA